MCELIYEMIISAVPCLIFIYLFFIFFPDEFRLMQMSGLLLLGLSARSPSVLSHKHSVFQESRMEDSRLLWMYKAATPNILTTGVVHHIYSAPGSLIMKPFDGLFVLSRPATSFNCL